HLPRGLGTVRGCLHFHAFRRLADAAGGEHALAFDLHHAGAAIAVGAITGLRRITQMWNLDAEPLGHLPDSLARQRLDVLAVERKFYGRAFTVRLAGHLVGGRRVRNARLASAHIRAAGGTLLIVAVTGRLLSVRISHDHQLPNGLVNSSGKYLITHSSGFGAAWPSPQMPASRFAADSSSSSFTSHGPLAISLAAFSVPTRHGVHWPQLSSSKNCIRFNAAAFMSSLSERITTACEPTKQPYFSRVPKSSGISAIEAGRMPPDGPPGRQPLHPGA